MGTKILNIISGKGGSGKSIIALSISKMLAELKFKVLLIDCDIATHGATYFYENELEKGSVNIASLQDLLIAPTKIERILKTTDSFDFIPSTNNLTNPEYPDFKNFKFVIKNLKGKYDIIIFDNQAGYSKLVKESVSIADKNLIVLEADAISSSAIRVLYLQLGEIMSNKNTWQLFNKLADEEVKIYSKVSGGTFFPNLPPIPFDWKVRASFALSKIPSVKEKDSAFSLAILRISKLIFNQFEDKINDYEQATMGAWFNDIKENLIKLENEKHQISKEIIEKKNRTSRNRTLWLSTIITSVSLFIVLFQLPIFKERINFNFSIELILGFLGILGGVSISIVTSFKSRQDKEIEFRRERMNILMNDIDRYKTLIATDPKLNEYFKYGQ